MYVVKLICLIILFEKVIFKFDFKIMICLVWYDIVICFRDFRGF